MTKRAVLYARVSGDDRKYATSGIENQLADCRKYAGERGYEVVSEFYETPDKATSGADWLPELDRVMKLAQGGGFDVLIVREIDRLARNRFKQMSVEIQLESCGARVEYVTQQFEDSAEGRLLKGLMSEFAEYEREKTKWRTNNGRVQSVKKGNVMTGSSFAPYGYDLATVDGRRTLVVNEQEADVIRLIFDLYVNQGMSINALVYYLSDRHIPKPGKTENHLKRSQSEKWNAPSILNILGNETYIGHWHYRKTKSVKTTQGKKKQFDRPREEWIEVKVPPIIDEAIYKAAQRQRETNKRLMGKQHRRFYLLGGLLKCGHCGYSATGLTHTPGDKSYSYYKCAACHLPRRYNVTCDNNHSYPVERVDRRVWEFVTAVYRSPELLQEMLDNYQARQTDEQSPILRMIESTAARLEETEKEKARIMKAYTSGVYSLDDLAKEKPSLDKLAADLTRALSELRKELNPATMTQDDIDRIQQDAADLRAGILSADDDPQAQRRILELIQFEGRLVLEGGQEFIDVDSIIGAARLSTELTSIHFPSCDRTARPRFGSGGAPASRRCAALRTNGRRQS